MKNKNEVFAAVLGAALITALFHKQLPGLNVLLYEAIFFLWLMGTKQISFKSRNQVTINLGLLITLIATIFTHSVFAYIIHFLVLFVFIGLLIYPEAKSLLNSLGMASVNLLNAQVQFQVEAGNKKVNGQKVGNKLWKARIFLIPIIIIILFIILYSASNPVFDKLVSTIVVRISNFLDTIFQDFDFLIILTFLIGLLISNFLIFRIPNKHIIESDYCSEEILTRTKGKNNSKHSWLALKNEYKAGIFLFIVLNAILLILNIIDINWVWFNFKWEGQYLKQFVHEGTYLLIFSILISIGLVLYFFRNNLNFYPKNTLLKYLGYAWLVQNGILTVSVAIRNFWYIHYFALAYKRIGVIIFLILTLYGLYTVFVKVKYKKSAFYLFKSNIYAIFVVLIISSLPNWDSIIARYNFAHADRSFLHLDYLSSLSGKSLPYLDKSIEELTAIDKLQKEKFPFEVKFMSPEAYYDKIEIRKTEFIKDWESRSILEWNFPDYMAYKTIKQQ